MKDDFVTKIAQIDEVTTANPGTTRVVGLVVITLGFLYILAVLAGILVGGWLIGRWLTRAHEEPFLLLLFPTAFLLFASVVEACWIKSSPLEGTVITREDAPGLFALIDELARSLDTSVHEVLVDTEFNAAATRRRRRLLGRPRNVIIVGYPLLCALDADDWRSVLAHEVAHIVSAHTHNLNIFWSATNAWRGIEERLRERKHWASRLFGWYFQRFAQLVYVLGMALRRQQEREADAMTAQIVGERTRSHALLRLTVRRDLTESQFWHPFEVRAKRDPEPPATVYSLELPAFLDRLHQLDSREALRLALTRRTEWHGTHPSTYDRHSKAFNLTAVEIDAFVDSWVHPPIGEPAIKTLFSEAARRRLAAEFDATWQESQSQTWSDAYALATARRQKLDAIEIEMATRELSVEERIERAALITQLEDERVAEPVVRAVLRDAPDNTSLLYYLGLLCLYRDDAEGVGLMERAIAAAPGLMARGTQLLLEYARRQGDLRAAYGYEERHHLAGVHRREREADRKLSAASRFVHADLSPEMVEAATRVLPNEPLVRRAWVAEIIVRHKVGRPVYVLMLDTGWWVPRARRRDRSLTHRIAPECRFYGKGIVVTVHTIRPRLRRRIRRAASAPIYTRGGAAAGVPVRATVDV